MELNTYPKRPDWLTDNKIKELKKDLEECVPYTEEELAELEYDGDVDIGRHNAYTALKTLKYFGLLED